MATYHGMCKNCGSLITIDDSKENCECVFCHCVFPRDEAEKIKQNKLFAVLSALKYIVDIISPNNSFKQNLLTLLQEPHKLLSFREVGFPQNWQQIPVWH